MKIEWKMYSFNGTWHGKLDAKDQGLHIEYPMHEHWVSDGVLNWLRAMERSRGKIEGAEKIEKDIRWWEAGED